MDTQELVAGWRELAREVSRRIGRPVGVSRVRWRIENSGLVVGERLAAMLVFSPADVEAVVRLFEGERGAVA